MMLFQTTTSMQAAHHLVGLVEATSASISDENPIVNLRQNAPSSRSGILA